MTLVKFLKPASGPGFGPYEAGDVADLNAGDVTKHTADTDARPPGQWGVPATGHPTVITAPAGAVANKKGT